MRKSSSSNLIFGFLLGLAAASALFSFFGGSADDDAAGVRQLKVAHALPASHPVHAGMEYMATRLAEISGGSLKIDIIRVSRSMLPFYVVMVLALMLITYRAPLSMFLPKLLGYHRGLYM